MARRIFFLLMIPIFIISCGDGNKKAEKSLKAENTQKARLPENTTAITKAVLESYEGFSFEQGEMPDYDKLRTRFTETAQLAFKRGDSIISFPVAEYLESHKSNVEEGRLTALDEKQVFGRTENFGDIAHHLSTYEARVNDADTVSERGIISYQLIKREGEWLIHSMIWESEKEELQIPESYK